MPPFLRILYVFSVIFFGVGMQSMKSAPILRCWKCSDLVFSAGGKIFFASAFLRQQAAGDIELFSRQWTVFSCRVSSTAVFLRSASFLMSLSSVSKSTVPFPYRSHGSDQEFSH